MLNGWNSISPGKFGRCQRSVLNRSPHGSTAYDPSLAEEIADCWDEIQAEIGHDEFLKYVHTVISLIRTSGADADLRDVLRDLLRDPQAAVRFRQFLTLFFSRYIGLEAGTLEFGANTKEINRITACLRSLPFEDWRTPALIWLAKQPTPKAAYDFFKALEALSLRALCSWTDPAPDSQTLSACHSRGSRRDGFDFKWCALPEQR